MAYTIDPTNGDIIIGGFEKGIGESPYSGFTDIKSINPISIPGEASVSFSTQSVTAAPNYQNLTVTAQDISGINRLQVSTNTNSFLEAGQAFTVSNSSVTGATTGTLYYISQAASDGPNVESIAINTSYGTTAILTTGTTGTFLLSVVAPSLPKYFTKARGSNWMIDSSGRVWTDALITSASNFTATASWTYTGNTVDNTSNGNGIVCFQTIHDGSGAVGSPATVDETIFAFRNGQIDYLPITSVTSISPLSYSWVYGWKPSTGTTGTTQYLQNISTINSSHQAIITPSNQVTYCDANFMGLFYQNVPALPVTQYTGFNPKDSSTYFFNDYPVLPANDIAQSLTFLNQYVLIGGKLNYIYPWDQVHNNYTAPLIIIPENNISALVTVGNNAYIFAGNRGKIYITNGSQASFYKKVPDHISGSVEPYFYWGGSFSAPNNVPTGTAAFNKNRLYFGCQVTAQSTGNAVSGYGGIWCIDLDTGYLWLCNQLSYGTYSGGVSALQVPVASGGGGIASPFKGYGLLAGWTDGGVPVPGIDASIANPYNAGQSYIISDIIPIGTAIQPTTFGQLEYKLSNPLVLGESVNLSVASTLGGSYTSVGTTATAGAISDIFSSNVQQQQWLLVKATLTSTNTNPSYVRLTQIRVKGGTSSDNIPTQPFSIQ